MAMYEIETAELISHLEDAARNDFKSKPGTPEPHRDLMLHAADHIRNLERKLTAQKNKQP